MGNSSNNKLRNVGTSDGNPSNYSTRTSWGGDPMEAEGICFILYCLLVNKQTNNNKTTNKSKKFLQNMLALMTGEKSGI